MANIAVLGKLYLKNLEDRFKRPDTEFKICDPNSIVNILIILRTWNQQRFDFSLFYIFVGSANVFPGIMSDFFCK